LGWFFFAGFIGYSTFISDPPNLRHFFFWPQQKSLWRTIVSMNLLVKEVSQAAKQPALVLKWQTAWRSDRILEFHMLTHTHKLLRNYGKSPCLLGKLTITMAIFNSKL
jgi:hypothetical protein